MVPKSVIFNVIKLLVGNLRFVPLQMVINEQKFFVFLKYALEAPISCNLLINTYLSYAKIKGQFCHTSGTKHN